MPTGVVATTDCVTPVVYAIPSEVAPAIFTDANNNWWFFEVSMLYNELSEVSNLYVLPLAKVSLGDSTPLI